MIKAFAISDGLIAYRIFPDSYLKIQQIADSGRLYR